MEIKLKKTIKQTATLLLNILIQFFTFQLLCDDVVGKPIRRSGSMQLPFPVAGALAVGPIEQDGSLSVQSVFSAVSQTSYFSDQLSGNQSYPILCSHLEPLSKPYDPKHRNPAPTSSPFPLQHLSFR
jgi:hypothetical protein